MANRTNHPPSRMRKPGAFCASGIRGVSFILTENGTHSISVSYFDEDGVQRNTQRSVEKHGLESALRYALGTRRKYGALHVPTLGKAMDLYAEWLYHL